MAHGNEVMPYPQGPRHDWKRRLRQRVLAAAQGVICNSRYTEGLVRAACPQARTIAIPLGVDVARFQPGQDKAAARRRFGLPEDGRIVLSVSRLNAYKGHDTVLQAMAGLSPAEREGLCYAVAGKGEHLAALQAMATGLGITDNIRWLGYVADDDLPALYAAADLFILCTREDVRDRGVEGFGLAFLEAQASGIPVLGTNAGGIPDAIAEERGGWLVPQDDSEAVRGYLRKLVVSPEVFAEQGRLASERVEAECTWDVYVARIIEAIGLAPDFAQCNKEGSES